MEYLDVVDEENNLTGKTEERDIIHAKGLWHREISVWIMNQNKELLIQKRAATKKQGANNWSTCAGHVDIGEDPQKTAIREIKEELGIEVKETELEYLFTEKISVVLSNSYNNIFSYKYLLKTTALIEDYKINLEELSEVRYISFDEVEQLMKDKPKNYPFASKAYMPEMLELLKKK
ncbi:MAG: NUDIX domain-containing protein [Oscillospiraceae bacterium]|nr:NUDIX domain-containing protein [Oscillospiraceae bacterium]